MSTRWPCTASRSTGTTGSSTSGRRSCRRSRPSPTCRSGCPRSASRPSAPRRCRCSGCKRTAELLIGPRAADPLVQPLRPAARLAGHHPPPRGRGLVLLPALLHGPAARGRLAQAGPAALPRAARRSSASASGSISRTTGSTTPCAGCASWACSHLRTGLSWADFYRPDALAWFDRQMAALEEFQVTVTFCFTPEHKGVIPHYTSPPAQPAEFAEFCAAMVRRYAPARVRRTGRAVAGVTAEPVPGASGPCGGADRGTGRASWWPIRTTR